MIDATREVAVGLVDDRELLRQLRRRGHRVRRIEDLRSVPLARLDRLSRTSADATVMLASFEGAALGLGTGLLAPADAAALLILNQRYIALTAHTYGFRTDSTRERAFMTSVLGVASARGRIRDALLTTAFEIGAEAVSVRGASAMGTHAAPALLQRVAAQVGLRLSRGTAARLIPLFGAAICGGANYAFTREVAVTARMMYRKRWLLARARSRQAASRASVATDRERSTSAVFAS